MPAQTDLTTATTSSDVMNALPTSQVRALFLNENGAELLDQNALPLDVRYILIRTVAEMADAISTMIVRGAPAIGIAAAYGVVLGAREYVTHPNQTLDAMKALLRADMALLNSTRPTAVNLAWALAEMQSVLSDTDGITSCLDLLDALTSKAQSIHQTDIAACQAIGEAGAPLVPKGAGILTHCNAGALATGGYGTALGVVRSAFARDQSIQVFADETRPRFQGARLTTWELCADNIPVTLIADNMAAVLMRDKRIQFVVVGADRITANGDTANKIGTYGVAVQAFVHNVPFYIAAPLSTIDMSLATGDDIPIEERDSAEVSTINGERICAAATQFFNPAFDVTPAKYIHGIITEKGVVRPDTNGSFVSGLKALFA